MISRVYTFERFLQILIEKKFYFISPAKWDDPWEAIPYRELYHGKPEMIIPIYGSCWSKNKETDLAWRAYSPHNNGIMIFAEEKLLLDYFNEMVLKEFPESTVEGNVVDYLPSKEVNELNRSNVNTGFLPDPLTRERHKVVFFGNGQTDRINLGKLFVKRDFFETEREYRFIIHLSNGLAIQVAEAYCIPFDPNNFISKIILDPHIKGYDFEFYKGLISRLGFNKKILRSRIYEEPPE